jgi:toxin YoeB
VKNSKESIVPTYKITLSVKAQEDIDRHHKSGNKLAMKRFARIWEELEKHPRTGIGNPEEKKYNYSGYWSRKITEKHRMLYRINEETKTVYIEAAYNHYNDK